MLEETGRAVHDVDVQWLQEIRDELRHLASELSTDALPGSAWQEYGGPLVNLRNVVRALTEVTEWSKRSGPSTRRSKRHPVSGRVSARRSRVLRSR